jgi:hypothetical protein
LWKKILSCKLLSSSIVYTMFDFVIYKMDKYFTEMKTMIFELRYGNVDDRPVPYENDAHDLWLLE